MIGFVRRGVRVRLLVALALCTLLASGLVVCAPVVIGAASSRAAAAAAPPHTARVCQDDIVNGVLQSTGAEAFLQLTVPAGAHVKIYGHVFLLSTDVNGQYRTKFKLDQLDGDSSLNMSGEFEGGYYFFSQPNSHSVGWDFDNTGAERTATVRLSHEISNVLGFSLQVYYGNVPRPIDCEQVSSGELYGPNIALVNPCPAEGQCADPVSTRSGNWHMPLPGLTVPGRGPGLSFDIAYNSLAASVAGKAGNGWSTTLDMALKFNSNGSRTVVQETGSTVTFYPQGGGLAAPARFSAELTENTDGTFTYERKNFERFRFGSTGRLLSISDRNGNTTTLTYPSGSTEATYMEDNSGRRLHFSWSGGLLQAVTDDLGSASGGPRSLELGYSSGKLTSFTDVADKVWTLTYDSSGRLSTFRKPRFAGSPAKAVETHYDGIGRVGWQEDELNNRTTIAYDVGNPGWTKITDPEGNVRMDRYLNGRRTEVVDGYGTSSATTTKYQYDHVTFGVIDRTDGRGNRWRASYDDRGNRLFEEDPLGRITRWEYNALDQVTMRSTGEVRTGATTTSTASQVTDRATYGSDGNPLSVTRAHGTGVAALTQFVHGDAGHPEDITSVIDARNKTWTAQYAPGTGDVTAVTDPLGGKTTWAYNEVGWVTAAVSPKGNVSGATASDYRTVFERNLRGQITKATSPLGDVVDLGYNADGNLTSTETHLSTADTAPQTTTYGYDDAGRLVGADEPGPGARAMEYDGNGDLTAQIDEAGVRTDYAYDPLRRVSQVTAPGGKVTGYGYDAALNLVTIAQPGSGSTCAGTKVNCITVSYDAAGQRTGVDYSDPSTPDVPAITYDALGRVTAQSAAGRTETWSWDAQDRLTAHLDDNNRTTGYGWDAAGHLTSITYPGTGKVVSRVFDDAGHLKSTTDWAGRTTTFDYDANSNWTQTNFPAASTNTDLRTFDRADQLTGVTWKRGTSTLGSLTYGARDPNGLVTSVTAAGAGTESNTWGYDDRNQLTSTATEGFAYDAVSNLVDADGVRQTFDAAQQLCWTSPTAATGSCDSPASDATTYGFDARGNRTAKVLTSGTTTSYGFDQANRLTSADVPTAYDPESRQFQLLAGGAARVADGSDGTGSCNSAPCAPFTASTTYDVDVAGQGGVPATGVTAVTGSITVTDPDGDGWLSVNPAGDAAAATIPLQDGQTATATFTARLDASGEIQVETDVDATVAIDITGYWTPPPAWIPALNYWPVTPAIAAQSNPSTGTCNNTACTTLSAGTTAVNVTGVGGVPATGVSAVTVAVVALGTTAGELRVAPNGDASAGAISWDSGFLYASGSFTVPVDSNGTIDIEVANATDIVLSVNGYWKMPTNNDTGLGLNVLDAPEQLVDTRDGTGTCNDDPCDQIPALTDVTIDVAGHAGVPDDATAALVSVNVVDPTAAGILGVGADPSEGAVPIVFEPGTDAQASFITSLSDDGTLNVNSWAATDLTIDVIGYFTLPTFNYTYDYDTTGLRSAKTFEGGPAEGGWANEYTWDRSGGLPMLLAEHNAAGTSYLIYGPGDTPIYQVTTSGDVMYYHQDHLGSTRLTTNANGTARGSLTYDAYGTIKTNTNPWFIEQPLLTYAGQQQDHETGLIYLRARYYDPTTGQFVSEDPAAPVTADPYGYSLQDPANSVDPTGLWPSWEDVRRTADDFGRAWDATGGRVLARAEDARQQVADIDLGPIDWGSGTAGMINVVLGYNKVGSGGIIIITGTAAIPFTGGVSGPAAYAVGGYQLATGGSKIVKGSRQLAQSTSCEDDQDQRLGSNLTRFLDEMTPNIDSIGDFLASLP